MHDEASLLAVFNRLHGRISDDDNQTNGILIFRLLGEAQLMVFSMRSTTHSFRNRMLRRHILSQDVMCKLLIISNSDGTYYGYFLGDMPVSTEASTHDCSSKKIS